MHVGDSPKFSKTCVIYVQVTLNLQKQLSFRGVLFALYRDLFLRDKTVIDLENKRKKG